MFDQRIISCWSSKDLAGYPEQGTQEEIQIPTSDASIWNEENSSLNYLLYAGLISSKKTSSQESKESITHGKHKSSIK